MTSARQPEVEAERDLSAISAALEESEAAPPVEFSGIRLLPDVESSRQAPSPSPAATAALGPAPAVSVMPSTGEPPSAPGFGALLLLAVAALYVLAAGLRLARVSRAGKSGGQH